MTPIITNREGLDFLSRLDADTLRRYASWFHALDAWTEYWDIYHPESNGRFYFGNGESEQGLLTQFLPRYTKPPPFTEWIRLASATGSFADFSRAVQVAPVASAIMEVDGLIHGLFTTHFGNAADAAVKEDYLQAMFCFATDSLPSAAERYSKISDDDPRKKTSGRHTLEGDIMWFAWALQIEAANALAEANAPADAKAGADAQHQRRTLQLAGVAMGCAVNFTWRGHRRTRSEYHPDEATAILLLQRARSWAKDFNATASEIYSLYRIREWGEES